MWQGLAIVYGTVLLFVISLLFGGDRRIPFVEGKLYLQWLDFLLIVLFLAVFWFLVLFVWGQVRRYRNRQLVWPSIFERTRSRSSSKWWDPARSGKEVLVRLYSMLEVWLVGIAVVVGMFLGPVTLLLLAALGRITKRTLDQELLNGLELGLWLYFIVNFGAFVYLGIDAGFLVSCLSLVLFSIIVCLFVLLAYGLNKLTLRFVLSDQPRQ